MRKYIPLSVPNLKGNELKYVTDVVEQEWVSTGGAYIDRFEREIANYLNVETAISCQNGTAGLHLSLILSDVTLSDEVIVPTLTFIAAVNPVKYTGASPIFMDCDDTLCMDMNKLEEFCQRECDYIENKLVNKKTEKTIKAMIVVHVFGNMVDMERATEIAKKYNLVLIEDATEALGTYYTDGVFSGKYAGTIGDIGVYSFNGNKIITTGGGGMLVAQNTMIAKKAKYLSTQAKDDPINFIHHEVGYNYRMTNLQAALGVAQLEKLEKFIEIKKRNFETYKAEIEDINGMAMMDFNYNTRPNYWFYSLLIENTDKYKKEDLISFLSENGIQARPIWGLISEQKPYKSEQSYKIERAKYYFNRIINIPCSSNLSNEDANFVVSKIKEFADKGWV